MIRYLGDEFKKWNYDAFWSRLVHRILLKSLRNDRSYKSNSAHMGGAMLYVFFVTAAVIVNEVDESKWSGKIMVDIAL
jgi:hypothetical protein